MNLVLITALVAVCSAAKLDRTYLPPPSAKTAGGSAGSLQTPFAGNSFNQGLGSFPKGSFTNEFQGVVVDAAAAGTRASDGETGLGAPRLSYGSTNSKVGDAAFRGNAGFRQRNTQGTGEEANFDSDVQAANTKVSGIPQGFEAKQREQPERAQAAYDRVANTLRFENEVGPDSYHFAFETDNGISAEENGVAVNGVQAQGGYSYTGDDGQVYSVSYTADEGGYQPRGDHLPTPPPIPLEILKSLEQNARDEAAGLIDDGSYDAQKYNAGDDYAESDITNVEQNNRRAPNFGRRPVPDATASGSFINQNNQAFVRPEPNGLSGQKDESSNNAFGSSSTDNSFGKTSQATRPQLNRFGSRDDYSSSNQQGFKQNGRTFVSNVDNNFQETAHAPQESRPSLPFGSSNRNTLESQSSSDNDKPSRNNGFESIRNSGGDNNFQQTAQAPQESRPSLPFGSSNRNILESQSSSDNDKPSRNNGFESIRNSGGDNNFQQTAQAPQESRPSLPFGLSNRNILESQSSSDNDKPSRNNGFESIRNSGGDNNFQQTAQAPQESRPSLPFGSSNRNILESQSSSDNDKPSRNNGFESTRNSGGVNNFQQTVQAYQESRPSLPFGSSNRNTLESQSSSDNDKPSRNNGFESTRNSASFAANRFTSRNEYLPPVQDQPGRPQRPTSSSYTTSEQSFSSISKNGNIQGSGQVQKSQDFEQNFSSVSNADAIAPQTFNSFKQKSQGLNNQFPQSTNRFSVQKEKVRDGKPSESQPQAFESQRPTSLPSLELTTPLESNEPSREDLNKPSDRKPSQETTFNAQNFNSRSPSQYENQSNNKQLARPTSNSQPKLPNTGFAAGGQQNQFLLSTNNQKPPQNEFVQNQPDDAQYSPSTLRPSFSQQSQGADDSYYYRHPAKPFNTPTSSNSRYPSAPSGQFNGLSQQSQAQYSDNSQQNFPVNSFQSQPNRGTTRYPKPPTLAPVVPTSSIKEEFQGSTTSSQYNGITQAASSPFRPQNGQATSRYPRPPTLAPTVPTSALGGYSSHLSGVTQAAASSFTAGTPTTATNINAPTFQTQYQQNQFQSSRGTSFGQRQPQDDSNKKQEDYSQSIPTQQYNGEIYEYTKPSEGLPTPAKPELTAAPQRSQTQFGQAQVNRNTQQFSAQQPTRPSFGSRPQFNSQQPQFSQNTASNSQDQPAEDSKSQFQIQSQSYEEEQSQGQQDFARPQFGQNSGKPNKCCQSLDAQISKLEGQRPTQSNNRGSVGAQFAQSETQFSGPYSQGSSQSFAGRGEVFGGPRKPPSFDQDTGYHY